MPKLLFYDNEMNWTCFRDVCAGGGFKVLIAADGNEGLAIVATGKPDLILMDTSLPMLDGWEATRRLEAAPDTAGIPRIGLTAHAMATDGDKWLEAGCDHYDPKPVEIERLLGKIERLLGAGAT